MSALTVANGLTDVRGASEMTGLAVQTLYNMRSHQEGPKSFRLRGRIRYYRADVDDWIRAEAARDAERRS